MLHIPSLERKLIYVSKMSDVGVKTMFEKGTCKMRCYGIDERN